MYVAINLCFTYMYFSTKYAYDYDDWSSYFGAGVVVLLLFELHAKFGTSGAKIHCVWHVTVTPTGHKVIYCGLGYLGLQWPSTLWLSQLERALCLNVCLFVGCGVERHG